MFPSSIAMAPSSSSSLGSDSDRAANTPASSCKNKKQVNGDSSSSDELSDGEVVDKYYRSPQGEHKLLFINSPERQRCQAIRELSTDTRPPELTRRLIPASLPTQGPHKAMSELQVQDMMATVTARMEKMATVTAQMEEKMDARISLFLEVLNAQIEGLREDLKVQKAQIERLKEDSRVNREDSRVNREDFMVNKAQIESLKEDSMVNKARIERLDKNFDRLDKDLTVSPNPLRLTILG
jgi:hypothetical protein